MNRIERAIDVFLDTINKGTLAKGTCVACAVGNLVAAGAMAEIVKYEDYFKCDYVNTHWKYAFITILGDQAVMLENFYDPEVLDNISKTEFSIEELRCIEFVFEINSCICYVDYAKHTAEEIRKDQIKGLTAVIKVMESFDQIEGYVEDFVNKVELIPCT